MSYETPTNYEEMAAKQRSQHEGEAGSANVNVGATLYEHALRRIDGVSVFKPTEALAADTPSYVIWQAPVAGKLKSVGFIPITAVTAHASNYATMALAIGTAGSMVTIDSFNSSTGTGSTWAALVKKAFTIVESTDTMAAGDVMTITVTKAASGVLIPQGVFIIDFERD
jgi:hypothetical protein